MRWRFLIGCWLIVLAAPAAVAQAPSSNAAQAQSLFDGGRALMQAGKLAEACAAFESSQKLEPRATTLLNLASCREKNNQLATARNVFADAGRLAHGEHNEKLVSVALNHVHKLDPRLSALTVVVTADHTVPGLELLRNGEKLDAASWNRPQPVDGGSYTITARAPGRTAWTVTRQVQPEHDAVQIDIPKLVDPGAVVAAAPPPPPVTAVADPRAATDAPPVPGVPTPAAAPISADHAQPGYAVPILVGAGALALGGVGIYFEVHSHTTNDRSEALHSQSLKDDANHQRIIGEVLDVAALAAAGAAVYLGIRVHRERDSEAVAITPVAGPSLTGLAISGHW